ncbi:UDP-N-acetylmuramoyl-tripeptide--D-alanyl-D-alanine ligase [Comamonadaceae bacterium G21597-S1]|nr:UDP-N-acetylmuramoyl-tripeptide--D-alanyl-D-alanine ligase [Comamonadaceae bacterium G21597-S1]
MMNLQQAARWLPGCTLVGDAATPVQRVHSDSRSLQPGDLFVAIRGDNFDGNRFLAQARAAGAAAALAHDADALRAAGLSGLVVADTRAALGQLATRWREQFSLPLIAVTGSNGKTTVTQMLASILQHWMPGAALATQGNFNNDIGLPLTLLRLRAEHRVAAVELGMNHPGEIALLAAMAQPTVALINNAQREHLEFMATVEAVARENGAVIDSLSATGTAVFPHDDGFAPLWRSRAGARVCLSFAIGSPPPVDGGSAADIRAQPPRWHDGAWQVRADTPAGLLAFALPMAGLHNVHNALAAASCAIAAGAPLTAVVAGLQAFEPVKGRSRTRLLDCDGRARTLVDDSYNANPDSVDAALEMLAMLPAPRLMVLGDMGEVGDEGPQFHAQAGARAHALGIEHLFTLGDLSAHAARSFPGARHFDAMPELIAAVTAHLPLVDSVLVKGSRFMRMERVVDALESRADASGTGATTGEAACC